LLVLGKQSNIRADSDHWLRTWWIVRSQWGY